MFHPCVLGQKKSFQHNHGWFAEIFLRPRWCRLSQSRRPPTPLLIGVTERGVDTVGSRRVWGSINWRFANGQPLNFWGLHMGVSLNGTPKWMVYNGKPYSDGVIWGYHYLRKRPYLVGKKNRLNNFKTSRPEMAEWVNEVFPKHKGWTQPNRSVGWNFCWRPWKRCKISMMKTLPHLASYFLMWGSRLHSDTPIHPGKIKWKNSKMEVDGRWCPFQNRWFVASTCQFSADVSKFGVTMRYRQVPPMDLGQHSDSTLKIIGRGEWMWRWQ